MKIRTNLLRPTFYSKLNNVIMKKHTPLFALILLVIMSLTACKPDIKQKNSITVHRDKDLLPPMEITISPAIQDDQELVEMVKSSEKAINQFSDNIERLADDVKVLLEKKDEEKSLGDGLRATKIMMSFVSNSSQISSTIKKFEAYMEKRKEQGTITDEQIEALDEVSKAFTNRMKELGKKYEHLLNEQK